MLVGDVIWSDVHDICFDYIVYDGTTKDWNEAPEIYASNGRWERKPPCAVLDMTVKYMTIKNDVLRIEAVK